MTAVLFCCISCSLKENRTECPCWLEIEMNSATERYGNITVAAYDSGYIFRDKLQTDDCPATYIKSVPKGYVFTSVVCGERNMMREGMNLIIPLGYPCDSIYAHCNEVKCTGEVARDTVTLRKHHAKVHLKLDDPMNLYEEYNFYVTGRICGINMLSLEPVRGDFRHLISFNEEDIGLFCLPRQRDDDVIFIQICVGKRIIDTLPLSEWIKEKGYDWDKLNLDDIYIGVDYSRSSVNVTIAEWEEGKDYNVQI